MDIITINLIKNKNVKPRILKTFDFQIIAVDGGSLQINGSSQIYTPNYGWLHDYFTRTVNAGNGLTGGGSGANLTISHPAYTAMTLGRTTHNGVTVDARGHVTNCNCACDCC